MHPNCLKGQAIGPLAEAVAPRSEPDTEVDQSSRPAIGERCEGMGGITPRQGCIGLAARGGDQSANVRLDGRTGTELQLRSAIDC